MELNVLGPLQVRDGRRTVDIGAARQRRLLCALLFDADETVAVDTLVERVWDDAERPEQAVRALRTYLRACARRLPAATASSRPGLAATSPCSTATARPYQVDSLVRECAGPMPSDPAQGRRAGRRGARAVAGPAVRRRRRPGVGDARGAAARGAAPVASRRTASTPCWRRASRRRRGRPAAGGRRPIRCGSGARAS